MGNQAPQHSNEWHYNIHCRLITSCSTISVFQLDVQVTRFYSSPNLNLPTRIHFRLFWAAVFFIPNPITSLALFAAVIDSIATAATL